MANVAESPRVRSVDVLLWLYRNYPDRFTIKDVMKNYDMQRGEAQRRVNYMRHSWSAVRIVGDVRAHRRGRREKVYALTKWGKKYAATAIRKAGRTAANRKRKR